jgi:ankyrin repeat protein
VSSRLIGLPVLTKTIRFLFARFLTDRFASLHTLKQVKALLRELAEGPDTPKTTVDVYHDMYRATLKRIDGQAERDKVLARKVLLWLSNAARLLSTQELRSALSIEPEDTEFDVDNLLSMDLIVSVCAGLVIVEEQSEIVRLVHYTAQEYFDSLGHDQRMKEQQELAATCLTYLCFDDFKTRSELESGEVVDEEAELFRMAPGWLVHHDGGIDSSTWGRDAYDSVRSGEVESVQITGRSYTGRDVGAIEHAFVDYAANFWALHAKECQTDILQLVLRLLTDHQLAAHAFHKATALHQRWAFLRTSDDLTSTRTTGLHLVAAIGLAHICRELLKILDNDRNIHADVKDDGGRTALMWAAHHGHVEIVDMLLDREDVRYDRTCSRGDTALNYAARQGKTAVIRSLIDDKKTDSHMIRNSFHSWGDYIQHENVGYRVRRENAFGETAIVQAALEGHDEVVKLLREHDTESIHHEVMFGLWPIHIAAQRRAVSIMELLIDECGVAADIEDPKGYSPFVVAADWNNEQVVRYFLQEKRDVLENKPEMVVQAAKVTAANWKREAILRLIVEEAGSMLGGVYLEELLEVAVSAGNVNMAIYLAAQKAKLNRGESIKATV